MTGKSMCKAGKSTQRTLSLKTLFKALHTLRWHVISLQKIWQMYTLYKQRNVVVFYRQEKDSPLTNNEICEKFSLHWHLKPGNKKL